MNPALGRCSVRQGDALISRSQSPPLARRSSGNRESVPQIEYVIPPGSACGLHPPRTCRSRPDVETPTLFCAAYYRHPENHV